MAFCEIFTLKIAQLGILWKIFLKLTLPLKTTKYLLLSFYVDELFLILKRTFFILKIKKNKFEL